MKPVCLRFREIRCIVAISATVLIASALSASASPKVGDPAPPVKAAKWFTSAPPALPGEPSEKKHVFIVEFWATWCPPCRKSIPHLSELHTKYGRDGLVVIGISNEESGDIEALPKHKDSKMPYHVGMDADMATNDKWMDDVDGIPHAYVVNQDNRVVWRGNPLEIEAMEQTIKDVLAGKFDLETAKNSEANANKYAELMKELQQKYGAYRSMEGEPADKKKAETAIFETLDKLMALKPKEIQPYLIKRQLLKDFDRADESAAADEKIWTMFRDSSAAMGQIAQAELGFELRRRTPGFMLKCARRLNELTEGRDAEALALLAEVESQVGLIDSAIRHQAEAVALEPKDADAARAEALAYYKAIKAVRDENADAEKSAANKSAD